MGQVAMDWSGVGFPGFAYTVERATDLRFRENLTALGTITASPE